MRNKLTPLTFVQAKSYFVKRAAENSACGCFDDRLVSTELTRLGQPKYGKQLARLGG